MTSRAVRHLGYIVVLTLGPLLWLGVTSSWMDGIVFGAIGCFFGLMMFSRLGSLSIPVTVVDRSGRRRACPRCGRALEGQARPCASREGDVPPV